MNKTLKLLILNVIISVIYVLYLIILDLIFVFILDEETTFLNYMPFLIITMPFLGLFATYYNLKSWPSPRWCKIIIVVMSFILMSILSYLEIMWVAIHFHTMIGGEI